MAQQTKSNQERIIENTFQACRQLATSDVEYLEPYLLIGYAYHYLNEFDLLVLLRGILGPDWIPYFFALSKKVTQPNQPPYTISGTDVRIPYSVLSDEFAAIFDLFKEFAENNGRTLKSFAELSEAISFYDTPLFEKYLQHARRIMDLRREMKRNKKSTLGVQMEEETEKGKEEEKPKETQVLDQPKEIPEEVPKVPKREIHVEVPLSEAPRPRPQKEQRKRPVPRTRSPKQEGVKGLAELDVPTPAVESKPVEDYVEVVPSSDVEDSEPESDMEMDFEESYEKRPLHTMYKRLVKHKSKREKAEKRRRGIRPESTENIAMESSEKHGKKVAKNVAPEIRKFRDDLKQGKVDDVQEVKVETKPKRKEIKLSTELKNEVIQRYVKGINTIFEQKPKGFEDVRVHDPSARYNHGLEQEEYDRFVRNAELAERLHPEFGYIYNESPIQHYMYLADDWWYNASLSRHEISILNFLNRLGTEESRRNLIVNINNALRTILARNVTVDELIIPNVYDRDKNFTWFSGDALFRTLGDSLYVGIANCKVGNQTLYYKVIEKLPLKIGVTA